MRAGRLWFAAMGLFLAAIGAATCAYLWMSYAKAKRMDAWVERPCTVVEIGLAEAGADRFGAPRHRVKLRFRYQFAEKDYESGRVKRVAIAPSSVKNLEKWLKRFPAGLETACYVDPEDPSMAVLVKDSKGAIYAMWFPALFFVGGLGIAAGAFRRKTVRP